MDPPRVLLLMNIGAGELLFLLLLILLLFGVNKIPELARSLGRAQREFQRARDEVEKEASPKADAEDDRVRRAAKDLGLPTEGRTTAELRTAIAARVQADPTYASPGTAAGGAPHSGR